MTRKQLVISCLLLVAGTLVFSCYSSFEARLLFVAQNQGVASLMTPALSKHMLLYGFLYALPYGVAVTSLIALVVAQLGRRISISSTLLRLLFGGVVGAIVGCVIVTAYFLVCLGTEVSFVLSSIVAGAPIGIGFFALFHPPPQVPGHCLCGYNLTGNESGVCPECGTEIGSSGPC